MLVGDPGSGAAPKKLPAADQENIQLSLCIKEYYRQHRRRPRDKNLSNRTVFAHIGLPRSSHTPLARLTHSELPIESEVLVGMGLISFVNLYLGKHNTQIIRNKERKVLITFYINLSYVCSKER